MRISFLFALPVICCSSIAQAPTPLHSARPERTITEKDFTLPQLPWLQETMVP